MKADVCGEFWHSCCPDFPNPTKQLRSPSGAGAAVIGAMRVEAQSAAGAVVASRRATGELLKTRIAKTFRQARLRKAARPDQDGRTARIQGGNNFCRSRTLEAGCADAEPVLTSGDCFEARAVLEAGTEPLMVSASGVTGSFNGPATATKAVGGATARFGGRGFRGEAACSEAASEARAFGARAAQRTEPWPGWWVGPVDRFVIRSPWREFPLRTPGKPD